MSVPCGDAQKCRAALCHTSSISRIPISPRYFSTSTKTCSPKITTPLALRMDHLPWSLLKKFHYIRGSFASLLRAIQARFAVSTWHSAVVLLLDKIKQDSIPLNMKYFQDLCCSLHYHGVYIPREVSSSHLAAQMDTFGLFRGWSTRPPITSIVIQVPRHKLQPLEELYVRAPVLECRTSGGHNDTSNDVFSSISAVFGRLGVQGNGERKVLRVYKDDLSLQGESDLILLFHVPTASLLGPSPLIRRVCLTIRPDPALALLVQLGFDLLLFSAAIDDEQHVHITNGTVLYPRKPLDVPKPTFYIQIAERNDVPTIESISTRVNITPDSSRTSLLAGARVSTTQVDPTTTTLQFTSFSARICWPSLVFRLNYPSAL